MDCVEYPGPHGIRVSIGMAFALNYLQSYNTMATPGVVKALERVMGRNAQPGESYRVFVSNEPTAFPDSDWLVADDRYS